MVGRLLSECIIISGDFMKRYGIMGRKVESIVLVLRGVHQGYKFLTPLNFREAPVKVLRRECQSPTTKASMVCRLLP